MDALLQRMYVLEGTGGFTSQATTAAAAGNGGTSNTPVRWLVAC